MTSSTSPTRAFAELDTAALGHNFSVVSALGGRTIAVVKANAYGHGLSLAVDTLVRAGCDFFAVATIDEALVVRAHAAHADVLILGYTPPSLAPLLIRENIIQTVFGAPYAFALSAAAPTPVRAHLKIDCGMHRLGIAPDDTQTISHVLRAPRIEFCGVFTHLPCVGCDPKGTQSAISAFASCIRGMPRLFTHVAASAALPLTEARFDGARPGLALYGLSDALPSLRPAMRVFAPVIQVHTLPAGTPVGYDAAFFTTRPSCIGVLPIGYADGIPRTASGYRVLCKDGSTAPIIGRVCMDQCMIDLTESHAKEGDTVCVIPDFASFAAHCGTIVYETLVGISHRVERRRKGE